MSAYKFRDCKTCSFHDVEPTICEQCRNGSEYQSRLTDLDQDMRDGYNYFHEDLGIE